MNRVQGRLTGAMIGATGIADCLNPGALFTKLAVATGVMAAGPFGLPCMLAAPINRFAANGL